MLDAPLRFNIYKDTSLEDVRKIVNADWDIKIPLCRELYAEQLNSSKMKKKSIG